MRVYLSRHGESEYNTTDIIGGDSKLTKKGEAYAVWLSDLIKNTIKPMVCLTSTKIRTIQTVGDCNYTSKSELDEINAGIAENLKFSEFYEQYPLEHMKRVNNKLTYRYPDGESYIDLISRTQRIIDEVLDSKQDTIIVSHQAITRALLFHLTNENIQQIPHLSIPLHTVIVIENGKIIDKIESPIS